jgi:hypothetical protein
MGIGTGRTLRTESSKIVLAQTPTDMSLRAYRAEVAESLIVVLARR